ncbi:MAG: DUF72 domain-containing protein [candidate division Zixibacteria bacterium]
MVNIRTPTGVNEGVTNSRLKIGTSGFAYRDWLGNFYPTFCPEKDFLRFYSSQFGSVEIDSTFYRIPTEKTVKRWAENTPDSFVFSAKFPRTVTHEGSLESRIDQANRFVDIMGNLGPKLGPLLLQFPYSFKVEKFDMLAALIDGIPAGLRISVELRNKGWLTDSLYHLLRSYRVALCLIDHPWMPKLKTQTAGFLYLRFLGDRKAIENDFSYERMDRLDDLLFWRDVIVEAKSKKTDIFAYFNNHFSGHSPTTARRLRDIVAV